MDIEELKSLVYQYVIDLMSYEEYHSFGSSEKFHRWVDEIYEPIKKSELVEGQTYKGICRNADKAIWNGNQFVYTRRKFGTEYSEKINHYEDDDGYDVFVPIKLK